MTRHDGRARCGRRRRHSRAVEAKPKRASAEIEQESIKSGKSSDSWMALIRPNPARTATPPTPPPRTLSATVTRRTASATATSNRAFQVAVVSSHFRRSCRVDIHPGQALGLAFLVVLLVVHGGRRSSTPRIRLNVVSTHTARRVDCLPLCDSDSPDAVFRRSTCRSRHLLAPAQAVGWLRACHLKPRISRELCAAAALHPRAHDEPHAQHALASGHAHQRPPPPRRHWRRHIRVRSRRAYFASLTPQSQLLPRPPRRVPPLQGPAAAPPHVRLRAPPIASPHALRRACILFILVRCVLCRLRALAFTRAAIPAYSLWSLRSSPSMAPSSPQTRAVGSGSCQQSSTVRAKSTLR